MGKANSRMWDWQCRVSGVIMMELVYLPSLMPYGRSTQPRKDGVCWQWEWGNQHRDTGTVSLALSPKPQNSVSPCMILILFEMLFLFGSPRWVLVSKILCTGPLSVSRFPSAFCLSPVDRIPDDFQSQMLCGLLFLAVVLRVGEPGVLMAKISLRILNCSTWIQGHFASPPFL